MITRKRRDIMAITTRLKCDKCGEVFDMKGSNTCPKCKQAVNIPQDGGLRIYRKGNPAGAAVGYGVYLNQQPYGHVANCGDVMIPLALGKYTLTMTCGMTRNCTPLAFEITNENLFIFVKGSLKMGFWSNTIMIEKVKESDMPKY